jgi:steroid delta-isomerase-like uncharacterized protein
MGVKENEQVIDAADEAFNAQDWDRFDELYAESVVRYGPESPEPLRGRAALRELVKGYRTAFPDSRFKKERSFGRDDWVCREYTITGSHTGPLTGPGGREAPATGKSIRLSVCRIVRVEGGKITEVRQYYDVLGMMARPGLAPRGR